MKTKLLDNVKSADHQEFSDLLQQELHADGLLDKFYEWLVEHDASVMNEAQKVFAAL